MAVVIDGITYVPENEAPDGVLFYYMHDNHCFSQLSGTTLDEVLAHADRLSVESRCGMLISPILMLRGKELRRLREVAHAPCVAQDTWAEGKALWRKECEADADVMRLVAGNKQD